MLEEPVSINHNEYMTSFDASNVIATDDDDGGDSTSYMEDYEIVGNSDDAEGDAYYVEYVTEDEDNLTMQSVAVSGDSNEDDQQQQQEQQLSAVDFDDDDGADTDEMYNCSTCGMNFRSVPEHIKKYHAEQGVLIDIEDESGATAIKIERALDLDDNNETDCGGDGDGDCEPDTYITADTVDMIDGELIVYGTGDDESLEDNDDDELTEYVVDENNESVVYTYEYDDTTGQLTRKGRKPTATRMSNKSTVNTNLFRI